MTNPVRVLNVLGTTNLGGAESRVMELYRALDRDQVQFDFLVHTEKEGQYSAEIRRLGGRIYSVPRFQVLNVFAYQKALRAFFRAHHEFAAVHGHMTSTAAIYLPIAKKAGIPVAIAHARSAGVDPGVKGLVTKVIRLPLKYRADYCFACSAEAAEAVYGRRWVRKGKVWTIPNAIDTRRFAFNPAVRHQVREELGLSGKFVIGHVGRFGFMKNHGFLIDIFAELCRMRDDAALVLIGKGELEEQVREKVRALGLSDKVHFLGNRFDVERYYQAFDYFVFPSTFEGLPGSVAEAQASGLCCLVSDQVTREAALTKLVTYKSIGEPAADWAGEIMKNAQRALERRDMHEAIADKGFDVHRQAAKMEAFYRSGKNPPGMITGKRGKKRVMLITPMLHQGGFERICVLTARLLADLYDVYLVVFSMEDVFYDVSGIHLIDLDLGAVPGKFGKAVNLLRRARKLSRLQKSLDIDVVYSFGQTANTACALSARRSHGRSYKKIAACHSFGEIGAKRYMDLIIRRTDHVICCSKAMAEEVRERYHTQRIHAVWNPCDLNEIQQKMAEGLPAAYQEIVSGGGRVIVSMGREDDVKGFWHLIKAFGRVHEKLPDTRLVIIGEGSFDEYKKMAARMGILQQITFTGTQKNPFPFLAAGSVYVLSSISEGLPNALVESLASGLVIVSANCRSGPAEILHGDWQQAQSGSGIQYADYGILTSALSPEKNLQVQMTDDKICLEDAQEELAEAVIRLLQDQELYQDYSRKAKKRAGDFSADQYKEAIIRLIET